jgi:Gas vesicle synthesis protein GvpO
MTLRNTSIALAAIIAALAGASVFDSASAYRVTTDETGDVARYERVRRYNRSAIRVGPEDVSRQRSLSVRGAPSMGGRGMRGGGRGRMNGGMGRR